MLRRCTEILICAVSNSEDKTDLCHLSREPGHLSRVPLTLHKERRISLGNVCTMYYEISPNTIIKLRVLKSYGRYEKWRAVALICLHTRPRFRTIWKIVRISAKKIKNEYTCRSDRERFIISECNIDYISSV